MRRAGLERIDALASGGAAAGAAASPTAGEDGSQVVSPSTQVQGAAADASMGSANPPLSEELAGWIHATVLWGQGRDLLAQVWPLITRPSPPLTSAVNKAMFGGELDHHYLLVRWQLRAYSPPRV